MLASFWFLFPVVFTGQTTSVCSNFGHNWAAEIRCLRSLLSQCQGEEGMKARGTSLHIEHILPPTTTRRPWIRSVRVGTEEDENMKTTDSRMTGRYGQFRSTHNPRMDYEWIMKNVSNGLDSKIMKIKETLEKEMSRRANELKNWIDFELAKISGGSVDVSLVRKNEMDIKKLTRRVDLLTAKIYRFDNHEYIFNTNRESWYRGEEICVEWGGHLASVTSGEENEFLTSLLNGESAWIGLNDVQLEQVYVNTDRVVTKFRHWTKGQPDNQNHNENCVEVRSNGQWDDLLCLLRRPFFCKR